LVGGDNDIGPKSSAGYEREPVADSFSEEAQASSHEQRMNPELKLAHQAVLQQGLRQKTVPVNNEVLAILLLERPQGDHSISPDHEGVAPRCFLQTV